MYMYMYMYMYLYAESPPKHQTAGRKPRSTRLQAESPRATTGTNAPPQLLISPLPPPPWNHSGRRRESFYFGLGLAPGPLREAA